MGESRVLDSPVRRSLSASALKGAEAGPEGIDCLFTP